MDDDSNSYKYLSDSVAAKKAKAARVYYFEVEGRGIRIGCTWEPKVRISTHERTWPNGRLLAMEHGYRALEGKRHRQFAEERIFERQEWFRPSEKLLEHIGGLGCD